MAWHWNDVFRTEDRGLLEDLAPDLRKREPITRRIVVLVAAGVLNWLEGHAAYAGLLKGEVDDLADLGIVEPSLDGHNESGRDAVCVQPIDGALPDGAQIGAAKLHKRIAFEGIKLEIEFEVRHVGGEASNELFVLGDPDSVGVHHQVANRALLRQIKDAEKIRMHCGLAARDLHYIRTPFIADDGIEHALNLI